MQSTTPKKASSKSEPSLSQLKPSSNVPHSKTQSEASHHFPQVTAINLKSSIEEKAESELGDQTYVVAVSDDSSSLSSLSEPSISSVSDQVVVVTPESVAKLRSTKCVERKLEDEEEGNGDREEGGRRDARTNSLRKQWIDDDVQVCMCMHAIIVYLVCS